MTTDENVDRFELEQQIMNCWRILDDLDTLADVYDREHTEDEVLNILIGIKDLYNQKFNKLFDVFEQCVKSELVGDNDHSQEYQ